MLQYMVNDSNRSLTSGVNIEILTVVFSCCFSSSAKHLRISHNALCFHYLFLISRLLSLVCKDWYWLDLANMYAVVNTQFCSKKLKPYLLNVIAEFRSSIHTINIMVFPSVMRTLKVTQLEACRFTYLSISMNWSDPCLATTGDTLDTNYSLPFSPVQVQVKNSHLYLIIFWQFGIPLFTFFRL
jgi:hypothetical protein